MTKVELSEVLAAHVRLTRSDRPFACTCEPHTSNSTAQHADHLADVVLAWVVERAGDAAVVEAASTQVSSPHGIHARVVACDVLTAFVGSLGRPGGAQEAHNRPLTAQEVEKVPAPGCEHDWRRVEPDGWFCRNCTTLRTREAQ